MTITIPDTLPTLSHGAHEPGEGKACVMEYVSVIAGEAFSDHPHCTHHLIAAVARSLNDSMYSDEARGLLVPLIPRLLTASAPDPDGKITRGLNKFLAEFSNGQIARLLAELPFSWKIVDQGVVVSAVAQVQDHTTEQVALLIGLLDEFDRLAGRTEPQPREVTLQQWDRASILVTGRPLVTAPVAVEVAPTEPKVKYMWTALVDTVHDKWFIKSDEAKPVEAVVPVLSASDVYMTKM